MALHLECEHAPKYSKKEQQQQQQTAQIANGYFISLDFWVYDLLKSSAWNYYETLATDLPSHQHYFMT